MSDRRRKPYDGCSVDGLRGRLRLRFRAYPEAEGRVVRIARLTPLADTSATRALLPPLAEAIGQVVKGGRDPLPVLDAFLGKIGVETSERKPAAVDPSARTLKA